MSLCLPGYNWNGNDAFIIALHVILCYGLRTCNRNWGRFSLFELERLNGEYVLWKNAFEC